MTPRLCAVTLAAAFSLTAALHVPGVATSHRFPRTAVRCSASFDRHLREGNVVAAIEEACAQAQPEPERGGSQPLDATVQARELLSCYEALKQQGSLRGFGSCADSLPAPQPRILMPDDQLRLTGLPTTAFAPPPSNGNGALVAGAAAATLLWASATGVGGADWRLLAPLGVCAGGLLVADRALLGGSGFDLAARALRPEYRRTVIEHEAGHFLVAYLLGCPVQACLVDAWAALRDGRFSGVAGTVFFDPQLGEGLAKGSLTRRMIDRYSIVVLGGIAAEAMLNGKAEGGQADEAALISLLASLDGGRSWDLPRIQNQARWAASQALLLLREHEAAYRGLCAGLDAGKPMGELIAGIEASFDAAFGRGELPAESRSRSLAQQQQARQQTAAAEAAAAESASAAATEAKAAEAEERLRDVEKRLRDIDERLSASDSSLKRRD